MSAPDSPLHSRECGERDFPPAVSHIPVHIGGPVLEPPVKKCPHLCVHIPQPVSLPAPAFNHVALQAQKISSPPVPLPGIQAAAGSSFTNLEVCSISSQGPLFEPFPPEENGKDLSVPWLLKLSLRGKYHRKQAPQENAHFVPFHPIRPGSPPSALISFSVRDAFVVNVGVDADRNACMVRNFTQTT